MLGSKKNVLKKIYEDKGMKRLLIIGMFVFIISGTMAYYILSYQSPTITGQVINGVSQFIVNKELDNFTIDVSSNLISSQVIELDNENSNVTMTYTLWTNITNLDIANCDNTDDLDFLLVGADGEIIPDSNFTMYGGINSFNFSAIAVSDKACPSEVQVNLNFQE